MRKTMQQLMLSELSQYLEKFYAIRIYDNEAILQGHYNDLADLLDKYPSTLDDNYYLIKIKTTINIKIFIDATE